MTSILSKFVQIVKLMEKELHIEGIRTDYRLAALQEDQVEKQPISQFRRWFAEALKAQVIEVNAMTLATLDEAGYPSARIVLLKAIEDDGFVFYTNYNSDKGTEMAAHAKVSLVFFWPDLQRQVRVKGTVSKVDDQTATAYFHSRPLGSQLGAWASPQSSVITNRSILEENLAHVTAKYAGQTVPKPPHWGGYLVKPISIEFWQGGADRLHDRIKYTAINDAWKIERLAP